MKAIQITQTGGPEVMSIREVPTPVPGPGEVLIRVAASGVNFIDLYVREGRYANPVPFIPGQEASGTIAAVGEGVRSFLKKEIASLGAASSAHTRSLHWLPPTVSYPFPRTSASNRQRR